jgi:hypothetical protein
MFRRLSLIGLFVSGLVQAQGITTLYQTQVPLNGNTTEARSLGLAQVLVKASGDDNMLMVPSIVKALKDPEPYIMQFGTEQKANQQWLSLQFDPQQIQSLLQQADISVWPMAQRPTVLVWWVRNENHHRELLWDQAHQQTQSAVLTSAEQLGLPLLWPVGDMTDAVAVNVPDVMGGFIQPIAKASERYQPNSVLLVSENVAGDGAVALHWRLFEGSPETLLSSSSYPVEGTASGSLPQSVKTMMSAVMAQLSLHRTQSIVNPTDTMVAQSITQIQVDNVPTAADFFQFEKWLKGLSALSSAKISSFQGDKVIFDVTLTGSFEQLQTQLVDSQKVRWIAPLESESKTVPKFEWQP